MTIELIAIGVIFWILTPLSLITPKATFFSKISFITGTILVLLGCALSLPQGTPSYYLYTNIITKVSFQLNAGASWLLMWGLIPALLAGISKKNSKWFASASLALLGGLGVASLQDGISFLISWELMSLSGAGLLLSERIKPIKQAGDANLFMLALLEIGSVALLFGCLILGVKDLSFYSWTTTWSHLSPIAAFGVGVLFLVGFGAKLGILPFYEWLPQAYASGTGASGAIISGVVLNMAWFGLARALLEWLPQSKTSVGFGVLVLAAGISTSVLSILYGFQQKDWRKLLSFSTAENAGLAVSALGAAILFRNSGHLQLASLAWIVGLIHLGGHSLAKGSLMLTADEVDHYSGSYDISQQGTSSKAPSILGLGAILGGMSLAAMPPVAGFVSEWYLLQTVFQGFYLSTSTGRVALALAGAGIALTSAIALATVVKLLGVGLLGKNNQITSKVQPKKRWIGAWSVFFLGFMTLAYAIGMPWLLNLLSFTSWTSMPNIVSKVHNGVILFPLSSKFAFISPTLLLVVGIIFSLLPITLIGLRGKSILKYRKVPVWAQGLERVPVQSATTSLSFSNALRQFYSFIYRPTNISQPLGNEKGYFVKELKFEYSEAPIFGPLLFTPIVKLVTLMSKWASKIQMGSMNAYISYIGLMLLAIFIFIIFF